MGMIYNKIASSADNSKKTLIDARGYHGEREREYRREGGRRYRREGGTRTC